MTNEQMVREIKLAHSSIMEVELHLHAGTMTVDHAESEVVIFMRDKAHAHEAAEAVSARLRDLLPWPVYANTKVTARWL